MASYVDVEDETILENIFKDSFPESWTANPDFLQYLAQLSSYGVEKLSKEPERLAEEKDQILEETQNLAYHNYKTFIQTADCSREIYQDFKIIENHVGNLLEKLPSFYTECETFLKKAQDIASSRRMNSLTLQRHAQLLEILEVPQLMDTCVRNGYYDDALELTQHVKRWEKKFPGIPVVVDIVRDVRNSSQLMLHQLIRQLRSSIQLPACLRVIGYLRRMDVFLEPELRIKFLQARDTWFQSILDGIPTDDPYNHITKTIELSRVHLFDIITQYRAIFSDEDPWLSTGAEHGPNEAALFHGWVVRKVSQFIATLESDLRAGVGGRLDSILGQCMYFGLSFSRVGADFRALLAPVFQRASLEYFRSAVMAANARFESNMQTYSLLAAPPAGSTANYGVPSQSDQLYPPTSLLLYQPLAVYCNNLLAAFNDLRLCAPLAIACDAATTLEDSMTSVNDVILAFHRAEESAFDDKERGAFIKFCETYTHDLVPYINRCLQALFPASQLAALLGVTLAEFNDLGKVGVMDEAKIMQTIKHLLPETSQEIDERTDTPTSSDSSKTANDPINQSGNIAQSNTNQSASSSDDTVTDQSDAAGQTCLMETVAPFDLPRDDDKAEIDVLKGDNFSAVELTDVDAVIDLDKVFQIESEG